MAAWIRRHAQAITGCRPLRFPGDFHALPCRDFHAYFHRISTRLPLPAARARKLVSAIHAPRYPCRTQMTLELDFSDLDSPRLTQTTFRPEPGATAIVTMDACGAAIDHRPDLLLKWTAGVQALCVLLLRWRSSGSRRLAHPDEAAATAFDFVRKCLEKEDDGHPLARICGGWKNAARLFRHSGSRQSAVAVELLEDAAKKLVVAKPKPAFIVRAVVQGSLRDLTPAECGLLAERIAARLTGRGVDRGEEADDAPLAARVQILASRRSVVGFLPVEAGLLPLRAGDYVRLHARFTAPVHSLAVWLDSSGQAASLHPWVDFAWKRPLALPQPESVLALPRARGEGWDINTPAGVETAIVLARRTPLDTTTLTAIEAALRKVPAPRVRPADLEAGPLAYFRHGTAPAAGTDVRLRIGPATVPPTHPFEPFQRDLAARFDRLDLDCLSLLSLPSLGPGTPAGPGAGRKKK
jgi:hypothetical protein